MKILSNEKGFSLIELVFAIAVLTIGLGSIYGVLHKGMGYMKTIGGKNFAVVAVSSEIEMVKAMAGDELPDSYEGPFLREVDLSALPSGEGFLKIERHEGSDGRLRKVTATVKWMAMGRPKSVSVSTMVSRP